MRFSEQIRFLYETILLNQYYYGFTKGHGYINKKNIEKFSHLLEFNDEEIINKFEVKFAKLIGDGSCVTYASARMGFYSLMRDLNIGLNDEVIILGFTCSVMPNAILKVGATPVFSDIDIETFGSSLKSIEKSITTKTRMVVAQHSFGIPCHIKPIKEFLQHKKIFLLEDCSITLSSKINNIQVGNFGDAAIFSFDHTKPINSFIGGAVYSKNNDLIYRLKNEQKSMPYLSIKKQKIILDRIKFEGKYYNPKSYGKSIIIDKIKRSLIKKESPFLDSDGSSKFHSNYPYPAKLSSFICALGIMELDNWEVEMQKRKYILRLFIESSIVNNIKDVIPKSYFDEDMEIIPLRFIYTHDSYEVLKQKLRGFLDVNGFWFKQPLIGCEYIKDLGYLSGTCPISENAGAKIINWPCIFGEHDSKKLIEYFNFVHN